MDKRLLLVVLAAVLLPFLAKTPTSFSAEQTAITTQDLLKAFTDDRGAAEEKYLNQTVQLKGVVLSTGISRFMTPNVELSDRAGGAAQAVCVLPRQDAEKLTGFKPGQSVTMSGKIYKFYSGRMVIKECQAVE